MDGMNVNEWDEPVQEWTECKGDGMSWYQNGRNVKGME